MLPIGYFRGRAGIPEHPRADARHCHLGDRLQHLAQPGSCVVAEWIAACHAIEVHAAEA
jgi:hypothetical protein